MSNFPYIGAILCAVILAITLYYVTKIKTERATLWGGLTLIVVGISASLAVSLVSADKDSLDFLRNFCIIIASIGGNFVAASALWSKK